jgi:hypothetical protein
LQIFREFLGSSLSFLLIFLRRLEMALQEKDRRHLSALYDAHIRHSSSSSSRSGASSRDSSETRPAPADHHHQNYLRKQSSPAYLSADYRSQFSTPSPGRSTGPHSRSQSVKYPSGHRRESATRQPSNSPRHHLALDLDVFRPRGSSNAEEDDKGHGDIYRLRNFAVTAKGVVKNQGDSIRTKSNSSLSTPMGSYQSTEVPPRNERLSVSSAYSTGADTSLSGETTSGSCNPKYKVLMSGAPGVGKTALTNQFLTSEYMNAYDSLLNGEFIGLQG